VEEKARNARERAVGTVRALKLPVIEPEEAFESIQRIEAREVPRLSDLMDTTVDEIDAYHAAVAQRERRIRDLQDELEGRYRFADIIGKSDPMRRLYDLLDKLVASDVPVLVPRQNGTAKALVARRRPSTGRKDKQFVAQLLGAERPAAGIGSSAREGLVHRRPRDKPGSSR
jgi:transcriptional regulator with GAF, ATPase, and Fis domain